MEELANRLYGCGALEDYYATWLGDWPGYFVAGHGVQCLRMALAAIESLETGHVEEVA